MSIPGTAPQPAPATVQSYLALVAQQHADKPQFMAFLQAMVAPFVSAQQALQAIADTAFDLDTAVGMQLDAVGVRVGISRYVSEPITGVFFSYDTPNLGWDQGVWLGPYTPADAVVALDDDTYRVVLYAKIAANNWDGTIAGAAAALALVFPPGNGTNVFIQDNMDMTMDFCMSGTLPSALLIAVFRSGLLLLRPMGVMANQIVTTVNGAPLFGFDVENTYISGFDVGAWGA